MALLVAVPVVVGSLGRIIVGGLTDRYGGRVMFPIVSGVTILPILFIAFFALDSYTLLLVGGFFLGIAGTAFAVGVPFVNAWFPPEKRGLAIGIFGAGMGGTAISALTTVKLTDHLGAKAPFLITAGVLACYALAAWLILRDAPGRVVPTTSLTSRISANARLPITWQACLLYAVAFGGYVAFSVYLPAYLKTAHGLTPADAANRMAGFVLVAVIMRPVGGWLADKLGAIPVLATGFGVVVGVCRHLGRDTAAARHRHGRVPRHGRRSRLRQRGYLRPHRQGHRALAGRRRDRPRRRRRRTGRLRPAADHGLRLRPHRLLRHRAVDALRHRRSRPAAHRHRRPPNRHSGTGSSLTPLEEVHVRDRDGRRPRRGARPQQKVLHPRDRLRPTCGPSPRPVGARADDFYRDRWSHDKVVRSTHGVNCTGSCSWKVYVKDGIITWETQQTDYPSVGPDSPEYEPRGCPRGAAFSWYTYSPTRVRYPYVRGVLLQMFREAKAQHDGDPVKAWEHIVENPQRAKAYKSARGKGGLVRATWDEASEIIAAAHVHTIKKYGPDRVAGFSPIPRCRWSRTPPVPGS